MAANDCDHGHFEVGPQVRLSPGQVIADSQHDGGEGGGAGAVELDVSFAEEFLEAAGDDAFEEGELVGVMVVEGDSVDGGGVGDVLDGDLVEVLFLEERFEGVLQEEAGTANARVDWFRGGHFAEATSVA